MFYSRSNALLLSIYFGFILLMGRFFYWQVWKSDELKEKAMMQLMKMEKEDPERGKIFFSDGSPAALNQTGYEVSVYKPNLKKDLKEVVSGLENIKPDLIKNESWIRFVVNPNQKWITLQDTFSEADKDKTEGFGLNIKTVEDRYYPEEKISQDIVGIVGRDLSGREIGYGGVEAYYDKQLRGKTGYRWLAEDASGQRVLSKKGWQMEAVNGRNLYLSINRSIQFLISQELQKGLVEYGADSGSIIVINPSDGKILALSSIQAAEASNSGARRNIAISDLFEPGSIFKPLVMAAALDNGSIRKDFVCPDCDRPRVIGEYTINNWDDGLHPNSDLKEIIKNSDNIGMSAIIQRLGLKKFLEYFDKLQLDRKTGVDLQGEAKPMKKEYWAEIDLATASFGQGFAINQLQMLRAFNTLANKGVLVNPRIIDHFDDDGKNIVPKTESTSRIYKEDTVDFIKDILKYGVENGAVSKLKPTSLEVCAKSGTAQIAIKGGYADTGTVGSYIGFSPCNNPKFTMIVTINNAKSSQWGSSTAAPLWYGIADKISRLL